MHLTLTLSFELLYVRRNSIRGLAALCAGACTRGVDPSLPKALPECTLVSGDSAMLARLAADGPEAPSGAENSMRSSFAVAPKSASRIRPSSWTSRLSA